MGEIVSLVSQTNDTSREFALATIDQLRQKIDAGEIVIFAAMGIDPKDNLQMYVGGGRKTRLQMIGALQSLLSTYLVVGGR